MNNELDELNLSIKQEMNNKSLKLKDVLQSIQNKKTNCLMQYESYLQEYQFEEAQFKEYMEYFTLSVSNNIIKFLAGSTNLFIKKINRQKMTFIDNLIYVTFKSLTLETWSSFNEKVKQAFADVRNEINEVKDIYPDIR